MATEVTLPQLGESVTEGTITAWLVDVGDTVEADQPLFELSSDKIDTEVPAPTSGVVSEIKVSVDETVDVGTVVAVIGEGEGETSQDAGAADAAPEAAEAEPAEAAAAGSADARAATEEARAAPSAEAAPTPPAAQAPAEGEGAAVTDALPVSPIVRRLAREHDIDLMSLSGSGQGGRITREDVEAAIAAQGDGAGAAEPSATAPSPSPSPASATTPQAAPRPDIKAGEREHLEDVSRIRHRIAQRMMESMQSTAQLTTVQEADVSAVMRLRAAHRETFKQREGASLSPFAFLARAAIIALKRHPTINAQADWEAGKIKYHDYVNLGIAVDTDKGLLVPNVKGADDLTLAALSRGIAEVADKARGKGKLEMHDIEGGTFTVTNTGSRGVLLDTPILNYPEVAILATGAIQQRPVVVDDGNGPAIAIRDMVYLCLTYDHQLIDGADAARFVTDVKEVVETHDWAGEIGY